MARARCVTKCYYEGRLWDPERDGSRTLYIEDGAVFEYGDKKKETYEKLKAPKHFELIGKAVLDEDGEVVDDDVIGGLIKQALGELDVNNDEHWTKSGQPAMLAVEAKVGQDLKRPQVEAAFPGFSRDTQPLSKLSAKSLLK